MSKAFDGQLALVTGASRGIGAAIAQALAAEGAHVILTARSAGALEQVEEAIHTAGGTATIAPLDLAQSDGIAKLAAAIGERWTALDIMVLNAAMLGSLSAVTAIDPAEFAKVMTLNVSAQAALIAAFDPLLRRSADARIVAMTSSVGRTPRAYWGAYGASKAAMETLVLAYGEEVSGVSKLRVAVIDPGATRTTMRARAYPGEDPAGVKPPEEVAARVTVLLGQDFVSGHIARID